METTLQQSTATMQAIVHRTYGAPDKLRTVEVPRPNPGPAEVLIEVHAAGVDRGVWHVMLGTPYLIRTMGYGLVKPKHQVPGFDVAGRVVAIGDEVTRFSVGDEVFGIARGAYADFAVADEKKLSHKPSNVTFEQAAVAAISGITALEAVIDKAHVDKGQNVLVIGASGGVGNYAVQLAKAAGAIVTGVASGSKAAFVSSLGADETVDYATDDYLDSGVRYDVIIDIAGRNPVRKLRRALTKTGTLVLVGGEGGGKVTGGIGRAVRATLVSPFVSQRLMMLASEEHHRHIDRLAEFMQRGEVTPPVWRSYDLPSATEAFADLAAGKAEGKSVIVIKK